jgi:transcriptional regulator with XRE-family HTH domain
VTGWAHGVYVPVMNIRLRRLTAELRRLRKEQGLTSRDVAKLLGISLATVSRIETIGLGLHRDALVELLTLYKVPRHEKAGLLQMLEQLNEPGLVSRAGSAAATWIDLERTAQRICSYEVMYVPGLLQTFPYAATILGSRLPPLTDEEVADRTAARIERQAVLRRRSLRFEAVVHEAALREVVGGPEIMHGQLVHLAEMISHPMVDLRVLPFGRGAHAGLGGTFSILDYRELPSVVMREGKIADLYLEERADIAVYRLYWDEIHRLAYGPEESAAFIKKIAATLSVDREGRERDEQVQ